MEPFGIHERRTHMRKRSSLLLAAGLAAALLGVSPADAAPKDPATDGAHGGFQMTVHSHSNNDPNSRSLLFPTDRLAYEFSEGDDFSYSSRPCAGFAPFNEVGLDFNPDYPGVDDDDGTAATRHHVEGVVTEVNGQTGTIEGTITSVLCENRAETGDVIVTEFVARYHRVSDNELALTGRFEINPTLSTGTFADLEGNGSLRASLVCLAFQRGTSPDTCAELGHFTDFVAFRGDPTAPAGEIDPGLVGSYRDPTVAPAA